MSVMYIKIWLCDDFVKGVYGYGIFDIVDRVIGYFVEN